MTQNSQNDLQHLYSLEVANLYTTDPYQEKPAHFLQNHFAAKCCMRAHTGYLKNNSLELEAVAFLVWVVQLAQLFD
jgi:hypothetical protein